MGGNVFPGLNRRYSKEEYLKLIDELTPVFYRIFTKFNICPALEDKESFGDMDVLGIPSCSWNLDFIKRKFISSYVKRNGSAWSLLYKDFQLDLIVTNELEYEFTKNYLGVYDRGNFIGKLAHQLGLKFGHDGLWLPVRLSDSHKLGDVLLTLDPKEAEAFLDVKPLDNAKTFKDVFDNIVASKYFNADTFRLENNNSIARIRDRKRPSYHEFLNMIDMYPKDASFVKAANKLEYLDLIFKSFPNAKPEYDKLFVLKERADLIASKFNGNLVSKWTGLTNKELGEFMIAVKFNPVLDLERMTLEEIEFLVMKEYNEH